MNTVQCLCCAVVLRNCLSVVALQHVICSVCVMLWCCATACLSLPYSMSSAVFVLCCSAVQLLVCHCLTACHQSYLLMQMQLNTLYKVLSASCQLSWPRSLQCVNIMCSAACGPGSCRIGLLRFQAGGHRRQPSLALVIFCLFCVVVFLYSGWLFAFVVLGLVSAVLAKRLAGKNISEMTYLFYVEVERQTSAQSEP